MRSPAAISIGPKLTRTNFGAITKEQQRTWCDALFEHAVVSKLATKYLAK